MSSSHAHAFTVTVLIPAHNEGSSTRRTGGHDGPTQLEETLESLRLQTRPADRVVVVADNCTDDTVELAVAAGVEVFETEGNTDKKAGALNQWLDRHLGTLGSTDLVLVMDADSALDIGFIEHALRYVDSGYHAVGGLFRGKDGGGFVGTLQRNEYARYARDVSRKSGRTLVLTGTATIFTAECLQDVVAHRADGALPGVRSAPSVYDTAALTEDNELTYALLHLGYRVIAPPECGLRTEVMTSWADLARQRYRWKRGAIENNRHYGITRFTAKYWGLQVWGMAGIGVTLIYLLTLAVALAVGGVQFHVVWAVVTGVYVLERVITVSGRGWRQCLLAATLLVEMPYDLFLQAVQVKAATGAMLRTRATW